MKLPRFPNFSFKRFFKGLYQEISKDEVPSLAAQMAYYFLFSMFPMMVFLVALLGFLPLEDLTTRFLAEVRRVSPKEFYDIIEGHVSGVVNVERPALLSFSVILALYSASAGVSATIQSLNRAYDVNDRRSFIKVKALALALTAGVSLLVLTATALIIGGDYVATYITQNFGRLGDAYAIGWKVMQWLLAPSAILLALAMLYYLGPDVKQKWKWVTPGSALATVLWLLVTVGFSYYVTNFGNFNATYGSLGGVMVTMLWLYLSSLVILVGGEVNALLEHMSAEGKEKGEHAPGVVAEAAQRPTSSGKPADSATEQAHREAPTRQAQEQGGAPKLEESVPSGRKQEEAENRRRYSERRSLDHVARSAVESSKRERSAEEEAQRLEDAVRSITVRHPGQGETIH